MIRLQTVCFLIFCSPIVSYATVVFSSAGNDLVVTFNAPIVLTVNQGDTQEAYGISIENVYTSDQGTNLATPTGDASMTLNAMPSSTTGENGGTVAPGAGIVGPRDLILAWEFDDPEQLLVNDTVTVSTGSRTIPGFLTGGTLPDTTASTLDLFLINLNGVQLSPAVTVPEPSAFLFLGLVGVAFAGWQWKKRRNA